MKEARSRVEGRETHKEAGVPNEEAVARETGQRDGNGKRMPFRVISEGEYERAAVEASARDGGDVKGSVIQKTE